MTMPNSALLFLAFILVATTSVANCLILVGTTNITQVQVIGIGLTCSNPSPLFLRPALSGATASLTCDQGLTVINATVTDASGSFVIIVNNAITGRLDFPLTCTVFITVPTSCIITRLFQTVTQLRSISVLPIRVDSSALGGQTLVVSARTFVAV